MLACIGLAIGSLPAAGAAGIVVRYASESPSLERADARAEAEVEVSRNLLLTRTQLVRTEPGVERDEALRELNADPAVAWAEPELFYRLDAARPNDPFWDDQWALENDGETFETDGIETPGIPGVDVGALSGWDTASSSRNTITAVIDSGVDLQHPDLEDQIAVNGDEVGGNGTDDDANGFVDDVNGWDFVSGDANPDDQDGHGTMVAGVIGAASGNATGISGISRDARIMPLRVCQGRNCSTARIVDAIGYAVRNGARVVNMSFGGPDASRATYDAMRAAPNVLFVAAAGNDGVDVDASPRYPCANDQIRLLDLPEWDQIDLFPIGNVICVAASDHRDNRPSFSNWGATTVDLAAPGNMIVTTHTDGTSHDYAYANGTSLAAPQVSGIASIAREYAPSLPPGSVKAGILGGAEVPRTSWAATPTVTGDRASLSGTLLWMDPEPPRRPEATAPADGTRTNSGSVQFGWTVADRTHVYELILDGVPVVSGTGLGSHNADVSPGEHEWQVRATNRLGLTSISPVRRFGYYPDSRVEIRAIITRHGRRQIIPYMWFSEPGTVRLTATATFRWRSGAKPRKRVIARLSTGVHAGGHYPRVKLNASGLRLRKVAPKKTAWLRADFSPDSPAAPDEAARSFRLGRLR